MLMNDVQAKVQIVTAAKGRYACTVLALDPTYGLAILKIGVSNSTALAFPYSMNSDRYNLSIGEEIYLIGHPEYLFNSFPIGHISYPYRSFGEVLKPLKNPLKKLKLSLEKEKNEGRGSRDRSAPPLFVVLITYILVMYLRVQFHLSK
ncbi:unnamed protein product [Cuscuta epithymum]|uniref:Uncharacterized protein n=1 Tax=Cuscuta epithymum TaxID=186058 RepID=A0AAV0EF97_9ASTE|nr:unnamed protein product [Cuscuta epithymum]